MGCCHGSTAKAELFSAVFSLASKAAPLALMEAKSSDSLMVATDF
jgi:hypothetical protein